MKTKPGRRGTDAASAWARDLRLRLFVEDDGKRKLVGTGIPAKDVKHLLLTIAQYVDHEGHCFPSFQTLSDDTEMSWDSIKRRLADLEYLRLIARFRRWRDDDGNINGDGRGRETSGEIRLLFETCQEEIDHLLATKAARDAGDFADDDAVSDEAMGCANSPPQADELGCANSPPRVGTAAHPRVNPSLEPDSPQSPPCGETEEGIRGGQGEGSEVNPEDDPRLIQAKADYGDATNRPSVLHSLWVAMDDDERSRFCTGCAGVRVVREQAKRDKRHKSLLDLAKFAADPALWAEYGRFAPPPAAPRPEFFVEFGTELWRGYIVRLTIAGYQLPKPNDVPGRGRGVILHRELGADTLALACYATTDLAVDISEWAILRERDEGGKALGPCRAWLDRVTEWYGEAKTARIWIDAQGNPVASARLAAKKLLPGLDAKHPIEFPLSFEGLRVPQEWPPPKTAKAA